MSKMSKNLPQNDLCICKICVCGRHHCPHQGIKTVVTGPCALSEYTNQYITRPLPHVQSYKPLATFSANSQPMEDKTNHRIDYVPHQLEKKFVHEREQYVPSELGFEKNTSYTSEYTPKIAERAVQFRKKDQDKELGKFDGTPSYKMDYKSWPITPREVYGKSPEWSPPTIDFNGLPTYSSDYVKYNNVSRRLAFKPNQELEDSKAPFQDFTDYRQSYIKHPLEQKWTKDAIEWSRPSVPFTGESTSNSDYREKPLSFNKSYKPSALAKLSSEPLQNETTNRVDYKPWGVEAPHFHQSERYQPPDGIMVTDTTYLRDYLPHAFDRAVAFKPKVLRDDLGHFKGISSYFDDFKKHDITPRMRFGPNREYIAPDVSMDCRTTHGIQFVPKEFSVRESYKRTGETHVSNAPFNGETLYRTEFTPKEIELCPTIMMNTPRSKFEYTGQVDENGHMFVAPKRIQGLNTEDNQSTLEVI